MLVNEAIVFAEQELKKSNNINSRLDSELLVSYLINVPREAIYSKLNENFSASNTEELKKLVSRRVKKEPIAYILNNKEFWSSNFYVDRSVLIPRPETEVLIDLLLSQIKDKHKYFEILDIGTGSGCILISLLKEPLINHHKALYNNLTMLDKQRNLDSSTIFPELYEEILK